VVITDVSVKTEKEDIEQVNEDDSEEVGFIQYDSIKVEEDAIALNGELEHIETFQINDDPREKSKINGSSQENNLDKSQVLDAVVNKLHLITNPRQFF